ncbi:MAG: hypothetical protein JRN68_01265 [Nitrososphaerota archaeon]|jgi:DNA primase small subunit|nr:hypothetical protein [Nitrososphaerota archaeon]
MAKLDEATRLHLKGEFRKYYFEQSSILDLPTDIPSREFGFLNFEGTMVRHLSFSDAGAVRAFLVKESPRGVFVSSAKYDSPSLPMEEKGFISANLVFDIDAGDLDLPCQREHDFFVCETCGTPSKSQISTCPSCGSSKIQLLKWSCDKCIKGSLNEALKLIDILESDLGLTGSSISLYFSGNRGHHVQVADSDYDVLDQPARTELVDYLTGKGFTPKVLGFSRDWSNFDVSKLPEKGEPGWRGRFARLISGEGLDAKQAVVALFNTQKDRFPSTIQQIVTPLGVRIDGAVTTDIHRIFRMAGTLHDKSGLLKKKIQDYQEDPFVSAVAIDASPVKVNVNFAPEFVLKGQKFGPFKSVEVRLPAYAAVYLECKGLARVVEQN